MLLAPSRQNRADPLFPYTTRFRSPVARRRAGQMECASRRDIGSDAHALGRARGHRDASADRGICSLAGKSGQLGNWRSGGRRLRSGRSEEHTSELQSLMRISYAVLCLKKKKTHIYNTTKPIS